MRRIIIIFIAAIVIFIFAVFKAGSYLSRPAHTKIAIPPADLLAEPVTISTPASQTISGWLVSGKVGKGVILLLHSVRANRQEMVGRAKFLNHLGYTVYLIDLPGHGESSGQYITYGINEAEGVKSALLYLNRRYPAEKMGVIGVSLGAASLVLSKPAPMPNAVVLESMFPSMEDAIANRLNLHFGHFASYLTPLLLWQFPLRYGIQPDQLMPVTEMITLHAPVLIASGELDKHTTLAETQRIYDATAEPKALWIVKGAAHVDLYDFDPKTYEEKISAFFEKYM